MKVLQIMLIAISGSLLLSMTTPNPTPTPASGGIEFYDGSWDEALALAKKENKIVFVDAYASWCGPCKMLKRNVFTDETVGAYFNKNFVNMEIDMERGEGPGLARKFHVRAYPTLIFVQPDGTIIKKAVGYHDKAKLLALGESAVSADAL